MPKKIIYLSIISIIVIAFTALAIPRLKCVYSVGVSAEKKNIVEKFSHAERPYALDVAELHDYWNHIHSGTDFMESGNFEMAKREANIAIQKSRSDGDIWVARGLLKRIYLAEGRTDLALNEVEWMLQNNQRPDVVSKLMNERENLLAAKAQAAQKTAYRTPLSGEGSEKMGS